LVYIGPLQGFICGAQSTIGSLPGAVIRTASSTLLMQLKSSRALINHKALAKTLLRHGLRSISPKIPDHQVRYLVTIGEFTSR
jgi:hypothetical protein